MEMRKLRQLENCIFCASAGFVSLASFLGLALFQLFTWHLSMFATRKEITRLPLRSILCRLLIHPVAQLIDICAKSM